MRVVKMGKGNKKQKHLIKKDRSNFHRPPEKKK